MTTIYVKIIVINLTPAIGYYFYIWKNKNKQFNHAVPIFVPLTKHYAEMKLMAYFLSAKHFF